MARPVPPVRRTRGQIVLDGALVVAFGAIGIGLGVLGAIGYPFEFPSYRDRGPRADRFWDSLDRGDPIWFADHLVWFPVAVLFLFVAVSIIGTRMAPRNAALRRLSVAILGACALTSLVLFVTMALLWILNVPASSSPEFTRGLPYLAPTVATAVTTVLSGALAVGGIRLGLLRWR
jgi:hypothetical protein